MDESRLLITKPFLTELHSYSLQHMPNEVSAMLTGGLCGDGWFISGFVHLRVIHSSERTVSVSTEDFIRKAQRWQPVGHIHSHPGPHSVPEPSKMDGLFMEYWTDVFRQNGWPEPFYMIYAPVPDVFSFYRHGQRFTAYRIVDELPLEQVIRRSSVVDIVYQVDQEKCHFAVSAPLTAAALIAALNTSLASRNRQLADSSSVQRKVDIALRMHQAGLPVDLGVVRVSAGGTNTGNAVLARVQELEAKLGQSQDNLMKVTVDRDQAHAALTRLERERRVLEARAQHAESLAQQSASETSRTREEAELRRKEAIAAQQELEKITQERDALKVTVQELSNRPAVSPQLEKQLQDASNERNRLRGECEKLEKEKAVLANDCEWWKRKAVDYGYVERPGRE